MSLRSAAALLILTACNMVEPVVDPPAPFDARVVDANVFSGGELLVRSAQFGYVGREPVAWIDAETLMVRRVDDSTFAVAMPMGNGQQVLHLALDGAGFGARTDTIRLHGFREMVVGPYLSGFLYVRPASPHVFGAGDWGLIEYDVRNGFIVRTWPDSVHSPDCTGGVGPSIYPRNIVLYGKDATGACTAASVWHDDVMLTRLASYPAFTFTAFAELRVGLLAGNDDAIHTLCPPPCGRLYQASASGVTVAAAARRAVTHGFRSLTFDAETGDSVYATLPGFEVTGAAFSSAEDTVYLSAPDDGFQPDSSTLAVLSSATGHLLAAVRVAGEATAVARDPIHRRMWVLALERINQPPASDSVVPVLHLVAEGSLERIASVRAPRDAAFWRNAFWQYRLVLDANAVYVVMTEQSFSAPTRNALVVRYDVVP